MTRSHKRVHRKFSDKISPVLKSVVAQSALTTTDDDDIDLVSQLCVMATVPTGDENPKSILRMISDHCIFSVYQHRDRLSKHPIISKVLHLFLIEWCYRNDHLWEDWHWQWNGAREGNIMFKAKRPLEIICPLPS